MTSRLLLIAGLALTLVGTAHAQGLIGLPDSLRQELRAPADLPQGQYAVVKTWSAESAGHNTGRLVADAKAIAGQAWEVRPATDEPGTMLYGPYLEIEPGEYVAFFRVRLLETADDDTVGTLDACTGFAQSLLAATDLIAPDLTVGKYVQIPLGFHYDKGKLECRLTWRGAGTLRVDEVSLFRLTGGRIDQGVWRALPAALSGLPKGLPYTTEPRPFPEIFPKSPAPARQLYVCDLRHERQDMRLLMMTLQGLVNRTQPRVYCLSVETDQQWLDNLKTRGWIDGATVATPEELLARFRDCYRGVIITDAALPASRNVATMLAGVKDGLAVSARLAKEHPTWPVLDDLRGRWQTSAAAYRWAFDNLWDRLNHHVLACSWPDHLGLRDYLVANRVFIFWIAGPLDGARKYASPTAEARLMEELLAKMPVNIPVMGYPWAGVDVGMGEGPGVTLLAEFGKYLVGSIDATNLTVHSGIVVPPLRQKAGPAAPALQPDKVYVAPVMSDGDNLPVLSLSNFPQLWADKTRGQLPMGWTMSPAASVLIPDVVDFYFRTATPQDEFLGAVSGVGYTYPDFYGARYRDPDRARVYDGFLDQTGKYMSECGLRDLWIMNATRPEVISRYAERIPQLNALFPDYGKRLAPGQEIAYATARNVPVFHAVTSWLEQGTHEERVARVVADLRRMTPTGRPAFLHFFLWNWGTDLALVQEALGQLGPDYVAVRPGQLADLWRQEMAREKVVAHFPGVVPALDGQPLTLRGDVRNVTATRQSVAMRVVAGLDQPVVDPPTAALAPAQVMPVTASGLPTAPSVELEIAGAFGTRRKTIRLRLTRLSELLTPLPEGAKLSPVAYFEAIDLPHRSGQQEADRDALGGSTWVVRPGQAEAGFVIFGPYAPLPAGRYVALLRVKRLGAGQGLVAKLDTCVGGGTPQTGRADLKAEDLPEGQYRLRPIVFDHPGGPFETRVDWAGACSLAVDGIGIWKIDGAAGK